MTSYALQLAAADSADWGGAANANTREPTDYCSREGALALKARIESYWRERGQEVMIALHNVGFHPAIRAARFDVRSDMVNGMPRRLARKTPAPSAQEALIEDFEGDDVAFD